MNYKPMTNLIPIVNNSLLLVVVVLSLSCIGLHRWVSGKSPQKDR